MPRPSRLAVAVLAVAVAGAAGWWALGRRPWAPGSPAWRAVDAQVARAFPGVATVSPEALAAWLASPQSDASGAPPILLDARTAAEFAVSHLPGAVRVDPDAGVAAWRAAVATARADDPGGERPVVVYCSVGVRSGRVAQALAQSGVGDVRNVPGSLFRWAAQGRPMVDAAGRPATRVHPYDAVWGRLLPPERRALR